MNDIHTAWVIPVHNRCAITLACLRRLRDDGVLAWSRAYVVDDGSTDATVAALAREFPEVKLLRGDGGLWWTGATNLGMRAAYADGMELICWLNDDTAPLPGACARLCATARATGSVVTGQCFVPQDGPLVYGGLCRRAVSLRLVHAKGDTPVPVDGTCGNFVCIPRHVITRIGYPDAGKLPHAFGDTDYTLRARQAGCQVLVDPGAVAYASPNALSNYASWLLSDISIVDIWRPLAQKRSYAYAPAHWRFLTRHFGVKGTLYWVWTVAKRVPISLLRLVVPLTWLRRIWGTRSTIWQEEQMLHKALDRNHDPGSR